MKKGLKKINGILAKAAIKVTAVTANTNCPFNIYQPKLPEAAKKMRKF